MSRFEKVKSYLQRVYGEHEIYVCVGLSMIGLSGLRFSFFSFPHLLGILMIAGSAGRLDTALRGCRLIRIHQTVAHLTTDQAQALHEATAAIYFADSSDYLSGLWEVVRALSPGHCGPAGER
jgi:hypothetical protein